MTGYHEDGDPMGLLHEDGTAPDPVAAVPVPPLFYFFAGFVTALVVRWAITTVPGAP